MAITWRDVQASNMTGALEARRRAVGDTSNGFGAIGDALVNLGRTADQNLQNDIAKREAEEAKALEDKKFGIINDINTSGLGDLDSFRDGNFLDGTGLDERGQGELLQAVNQRRQNIFNEQQGERDRYVSKVNFDNFKVNEAEKPVLNQVQTAIANNDYAKAKQLAGGLTNGGKLLQEINTAEKSFNERNTLDNLGVQFNTALNNRANAIRLNRNASNSKIDLLNEEKLAENSEMNWGQFLRVGADGKASIDLEELNKVGADSWDKKANGMSYSDFTTKLNQKVGGVNQGTFDIEDTQTLQSRIAQQAAMNNVNPRLISQAMNNVQPLFELDTVDSRINREKSIYSKINQNITEQRIQEIRDDEAMKLKQIAYDPTIPIGEQMEDIEDTLESYKQYAKGNSSAVDFGEGDFERFSKEAREGMKKLEDYRKEQIKTLDKNDPTYDEKVSILSTPLDGRVLAAALNAMDNVAEAKIDGNLGDWFDNIDSEELFTELKFYQNIYDNNMRNQFMEKRIRNNARESVNNLQNNLLYNELR